jgi:hypothetical protein
MKATVLRLTAGALVGASMAVPAGGVFAHGGTTPPRADVGFLDVHVHGDHVIRDYVKDPMVRSEAGRCSHPRRPRTGFHFTIEGSRRAHRSATRSAPNGFDTPDNVPVPGNPD